MFKENVLDVKGIKVGQIEDKNGLTGCSVVLCEKGATCGVDVRGSAPGTRETDLLNPINLVDKAHAVVLSGGSAFGLEATCGVAKYLEEKDIGFDVGVTKVPIVVGAVLFDLHVGDHKIRPNFKMGYEACEAASEDVLLQGNYGAGCGATVGKFKGIEYAMKGGIGSYSIRLDNGLIVSALIAVNPFGDVYENGKIIAGALDEKRKNFINTYETMKNGLTSQDFTMQNTTIGVVVTNGKLTKNECTKISQMAHNGYAKAIFPIHTMLDGDTIFTLATGEIECDVNLVGSLAAEVVEKSIIKGVKNSKSVENIPSYEEIYRNI